MSESENEKSTRLTVILPPAVRRALDERAAREATPVSILVRRWVVERLRAEEERGDDGAS